AEHGHADAENLAGAEMTVSEFCFAEKRFKCLHGVMIPLRTVAKGRCGLTMPHRGGSIRCPRFPMSELATTIGAVLKQKPRQVWSTPPDASVYECIETMAEKQVGALLVMQQGALLGIVSERDYAR